MGFIRDVRKGLMFLRRSPALTAEDRALIQQRLTEAERDLFYRMEPADQAHSVRVTRLCMEALAAHPQVDERVMVKAALLHDVGKIGADLGLVFRTLWVFGHALMPSVLDRVAARGASAPPGSLRRKMYDQLFHAAIGARMLAQVGTEPEVLHWIALTGEERRPDDPVEKQLLLAADGDVVLKPASRQNRPLSKLSPHNGARKAENR